MGVCPNADQFGNPSIGLATVPSVGADLATGGAGRIAHQFPEASLSAERASGRAGGWQSWPESQKGGQ